MPQDAAASGVTSDADSTKTGEDQTSDAGTSGDKDTQPDVEKIVAARLAQKLGKYGDLKELQRKAAEFDKQQTVNQSETERLQSRIAELEKQDAEREVERKRERIRSATVTAAAKLGFADPSDAYALLDQGEVEEDGSNVEKLLVALLKSKPYLSSNRIAGSADGGRQGDPAPNKLDMNTLLRAAAKG